MKFLEDFSQLFQMIHVFGVVRDRGSHLIVRNVIRDAHVAAA